MKKLFNCVELKQTHHRVALMDGLHALALLPFGRMTPQSNICCSLRSRDLPPRCRTQLERPEQAVNIQHEPGHTCFRTVLCELIGEPIN